MSQRDQHLSSEALFRLAVIWQVLNRTRLGEAHAAATEGVAACEHVFFDGTPRRVSARSLYRWLQAYAQHGAAGLEPAKRAEAPASKVLSQAFIDFLVQEKERDRPASIPELIRRARGRGILEEGRRVHRSTVYRTCRRLGLKVARRKGAKQRDARRFAFPHRMDMVLCDGKHFRAGAQRLKRVALFYLDDATRSHLHSVVGTSESTALFLRGLYECICKHGYSDGLYVDRGPGFIADDTVEVAHKIDSALIHGAAGYAEGHGKVEKFNQTAKNDVLRALDGRPDVDPSCGALELRLQHYGDKVYNHRPHESLGRDTPWQRFNADAKPLRYPEDRDSLRRKFEIHLERRVTPDNTVSIDSTPYDVPTGYASEKIIVWRRLLEGTVGFVHDGRVIDLLPTDLEANARAPRAKRVTGRDETTAIPPKTAAEDAFDRDFRPVVDADGGFHHDSDDSNDNLPW